MKSVLATTVLLLSSGAVVAIFSPPPGRAQEVGAPRSAEQPAEAAEADGPSPADRAETTARRWMQTRKSIGAEEAQWEEQKQLFTDLVAVREKEIASLEEVTVAAAERVETVKKERAKLKAEETELREWRKAAENRIANLEEQLRPLAGLFPEPLRQKVEESLLRLDEADPETALQDRYRDLVAILNAAAEFDGTITVQSELRDFGGEEVEVDVFYLGLTQAWYVDREQRHAGVGLPGADGWSWRSEPGLAQKIRRMIEIQRKESSPGFVSLPLINRAAQPVSNTNEEGGAE